MASATCCFRCSGVVLITARFANGDSELVKSRSGVRLSERFLDGGVEGFVGPLSLCHQGGALVGRVVAAGGLGVPTIAWPVLRLLC